MRSQRLFDMVNSEPRLDLFIAFMSGHIATDQATCDKINIVIDDWNARNARIARLTAPVDQHV